MPKPRTYRHGAPSRSLHAILPLLLLLFQTAWIDLAADDVTDVVINELQYNPASGDREEDFIELYNQSATETYSLGGWRFTAGVLFTFPDVAIGPRQYLVVCGNETRIRQVHGITNTVGNWDAVTTLDNGGERLRLVNGAGLEVEDFTFDDRSPWPILADGYGHSLERRNPAFDNDDPANWAASTVGSDWTHIVFTGTAASSSLYLYLPAAGTAYVDDVKLYPADDPGGDRVQNGGFEANLGPWLATGTHSGSTSSTERVKAGARSLKLVATGPGGSQANSVYQDNLGLVNGQQYTLDFWLYLAAPGQTIIARLEDSGGAGEPFYLEIGGGGATAGRQNSVFATDLPPFIFPAYHAPQAPVASQAVTLLAIVADDGAVGAVTAHWDTGGGEQTAPMLDDGLHQDGVAGDGLFGGSLGSFSTGTVVRYWVSATDDVGQNGRYPFAGNPTPTLGFYIQPSGISPSFVARSNSGLDSALPPVYHFLIDPSQLTAAGHLNGDLRLYRRGAFIFNGEVFDNVRIRHHGQSSIGAPKKHWKVDFNKDHRFLTPFAGHPEVDNVNIQSSYSDKSFLREWLGYKMWMNAGQPGLEVWHTRLYLNGVYRGLYMHLENPNEDWLDREGLDAEGWLWKANSQARGGTNGFELKHDTGNPAAANAALGSFISNMNNLTDQALVDYINANMNVASYVDYLACTQLIHNCDHPAKNYLVFADEDAPAGTWTYYIWDSDLTHGRNFECGGGGVNNDTIRSDMFGDPQLLFATSARPKCDGPWNGVINGFLQRTTVFRGAVYARTSELLDLYYHPAVVGPLIDDMSAPLAAEVELDWNRNTPYGNRATYQTHVNALKNWAQARYDYLSNALASLSGPDIENLACQRAGSTAALSWTNRAAYSSIKVYRNDVLLDTLPGSATTAMEALDLGLPANRFRVASILSGSEQPGDSCTLDTDTGDYITVIDEDFSSGAQGFGVNASASVAGGFLELTPPSPTQAGSSFFLTRFSDQDFIADFDLRLDEPSAPRGGDGLVFIINTGSDTSTAAAGAAGDGLGYFAGDTEPPVFEGFGVVFDARGSAGEPGDNWAGFIDASQGREPRAAVDVPEDFAGNGAFHARVVGTNGTFTLLLSNPTIGMAERQVFSYTVPGFTAGTAYFGFSAGTGEAFARHRVDNFVLQVRNTAPRPSAEFTASPTLGAAPLGVTFTNQSTNAATYEWSFGDGTTSTEVNPVHVYQSGGSYSVSLRAIGAGGVENRRIRGGFIRVDGPLTAEFSASPRQGVAPLPIQFTDLSSGATIQSWLWDFGDGQTSTQRSPSHMYTIGGNFTVRLEVFGYASSDREEKTSYITLTGRMGFIRGDVNGDGAVDIADAVGILNDLFVHTVDLDCRDAEDVDDSADINLTDVLRLLNYVFLEGPAPSPPFPVPGADPTFDLVSCDR